MTFKATEEAKAGALEALAEGRFKPESTDPRASAVYLLKSEGVPIISRNVGKGSLIVMEHELVETALNAEEIKARRTEGLAMALAWHRRESEKAWRSLLESIPCPFAKDAASEYLRGIMARVKATG